MIPGYGKVYAIGHPKIQSLLDGKVYVEEKIDGSQFSIMYKNGTLRARSRNQEIDINNPDNLFKEAVKVAKQRSMFLKDGWVYRCEYLKKPKHNVLKYDRIPHHHLIIFDIMKDEENYLLYNEKKREADRIGLEVVPLLYTGEIQNKEQLLSFLETDSILGGTKVEGIVVKNYNQFHEDTAKLMTGKLVSEKFKEKHKQADVGKHSYRNIIEDMVALFNREAIWQKAVQHLREDGLLENDPRDIGNLMKYVNMDIDTEYKEEIMWGLYKHFSKQIKKGITKGLAEWYKEQLVEKQFNK